MNTTLVIMAAGIGSRFGGGIKQLEPVGPKGEIIMDYSIHDALAAGFNNIIFIIRKDIEKDFKEIIGNRIEKIANVKYAYKELDALPKAYEKGERIKPWGTGHAVLCCRELIKEPFAVINADDYYGKDAFVKIHDCLQRSTKGQYCMAGFILKNTLSDNGGVTRGVCKVDDEGYLTQVVETRNIIKVAGEGGFEDSAGIIDSNGGITPIDKDSYVSMNMWGLRPEFIDALEEGFVNFLKSLKEGDAQSEYLLPTIIDGLIKDKKARVRLLETEDKWFGVTYKEDKEIVVSEFKKLISKGEYREGLF